MDRLLAAGLLGLIVGVSGCIWLAMEHPERWAKLIAPCECDHCLKRRAERAALERLLADTEV